LYLIIVVYFVKIRAKVIIFKVSLPLSQSISKEMPIFANPNNCKLNN